MSKDQVIAIVSRIRGAANRIISTELRERGLQSLVPSHGDILACLLFHGPMEMKSLAVLIGRDKSTITVLVDKLITLGFVEKSVDPNDARRRVIDLTAKGRKLRPSFEEISQRLLEATYRGFSEDEQDVLVGLLLRVKENLEK